MRIKILLRGIFLLFISALLAGKVPAQSPVDSMERAALSPVQDTQKVNLLNTLARSFLNSDPVKSKEYAGQALRLADSLSFQRGKASSLNTLGAIEMNSGQYNSALSRFEECLKITKEIQFQPGIGGSLNNIGNVNFRMGRYEKAIDYYLENKKLQEELKNPAGVDDMELNIGSVFHKLKEFGKALSNYENALKGYASRGEKNKQAVALQNIAAVQADQGKLDESIRSRELSMGLYKETGNLLGQAETEIQQGIALSEKGLPKEALIHIQNAGQIHLQLGNLAGQATALTEEGKILLKAKQSGTAITRLEKACSLAQAIQNKGIEKEATLSLSDAYAREGEFRKAYQIHLLYTELEEQHRNENNSQEIMMKDFRHQIEKKQLADSLETVKREAINEQRLRESRTVSRFSILGIVLMSLLGILLIRGYRNKVKANEEIAREKQRSEDLLLNILPRETAEELKKNGKAIPHKIADVSILFSDFEGFTHIAEQMEPDEIVRELDSIFSEFDSIAGEYGLEKIKTIGDSYMCAAGLKGDGKAAVQDMIQAGLKMLEAVEGFNQLNREAGRPIWNIRIGINTGEVVAGVVGKRKFAFDIWGDAVNTASRVEGAGVRNGVTLSEETWNRVKDAFDCEFIGRFLAKNKGELNLYKVIGMKGKAA